MCDEVLLGFALFAGRLTVVDYWRQSCSLNYEETRPEVTLIECRR